MGNFFRDLGSKFQAAQAGRNGSDKLSAISLGISFVLLIIELFVPNPILIVLVWVFLIYSIFRSWSKNVDARRAEQAKFDALWDRIFHRGQASSSRNRHAASKHPRKARNGSSSKSSSRASDKVVFNCEGCGQSLSVPRGRGTLKVTCPKCGKTTTVKS